MSRKVYKRNLNSPVPDGFKDFLIKLNLERVRLVSIAILLFQFANLFDDRIAEYWIMKISLIFMVVMAVVYLIGVRILVKKDTPTDETATKVYMSFWTVLCIGMLPYLALDSITIGQPINAMIFCFVIVVAPIFSRRQAIAIFSLFTICNLIISAIMAAPLHYYAYILVIGIVGYMFSAHIHENYIKIINQLTEETMTDFLTGITNRKGGFERSKSMLALCKRHKQVCVVYMVDIDYFKDYNDSFGHYMGDSALISVADCLKKCFTRKSDIYFRYGGEEFTVCISVDCKDTVFTLAESLRYKVEDMMIEAGNKEISPYLTISIGATAYIPDKTNINVTETELFARADEALYEAKSGGRNKVVLKEM